MPQGLTNFLTVFSRNIYIFSHHTVPITAVSMDFPGNLEVLVNKTQNISCTSYGRPAADIKFYKEINGIHAEITENVYTTYKKAGNGITIGTLPYMPSRDDEGAAIYCQANNTITRGLVKSTNRVIIVIIGKYTS